MKTLSLLVLISTVIALAACTSVDTVQISDVFTPREQITEVVNKLFVYTDEQNWEKLKSEVFDDYVFVDMVSVGAEKAQTMTAQEICDKWQEGFKGLDAIHHQSGDYIITIKSLNANVKAYAIASHYKKAATQGNVREFVGSYNLGLIRKESGWRINQFIYHMKYMTGNLDLE